MSPLRASMNAVAATITAARQSITSSKSAERTANHAPDAAVQRRSHRFCRGFLGAFLASVKKLCRWDNALWLSSARGVGANSRLELDSPDFGLLSMTIFFSPISMRNRCRVQRPQTPPDAPIWIDSSLIRRLYSDKRKISGVYSSIFAIIGYGHRGRQDVP